MRRGANVEIYSSEGARKIPFLIREIPLAVTVCAAGVIMLITGNNKQMDDTAGNVVSHNTPISDQRSMALSQQDTQRPVP